MDEGILLLDLSRAWKVTAATSPIFMFVNIHSPSFFDPWLIKIVCLNIWICLSNMKNTRLLLPSFIPCNIPVSTQ